MSKPPVTSSKHTLPFDKLSPADFERLCLWLVEREGYERAEHLGLAGSEQGRDVVAYRPAPGGEELWYFQCKRYRRIGVVTLKGEVDKYLSLVETQPHLRPAGIVFVISGPVSARVRDEVAGYCRQHGFRHEFWAHTELDMRVKRYPDIVQEFFGPVQRGLLPRRWVLAGLLIGVLALVVGSIPLVTHLSSNASPTPVVDMELHLKSSQAITFAPTLTLTLAPTPTPIVFPAPLPDLPTSLLVLVTGAGDSIEELGLVSELQRELGNTGSGGRVWNVDVSTVGDADAALLEGKRRDALLVLWAERSTGGDYRLHASFPVSPAYRIPLLQEPAWVELSASKEHVQQLAVTCALYASGQYERAYDWFQVIEPHYEDTEPVAELASLYWLWGNLALRQDHRDLWQKGYDAYTRAIASLERDSPLLPDLYANRGLLQMYAANAILAEPWDSRCVEQGRADFEEAYGLASVKQGDFLSGLGFIRLTCPDSDRDWQELAVRDAHDALSLTGESAMALSLMARVRIENLYDPELGNPLLVERDACQALKLDPALIEPYFTLGELYRANGRPDQARAAYMAYGQAALFEWQRRLARHGIEAIPSEVGNPTPGLDGCEPH